MYMTDSNHMNIQGKCGSGFSLHNDNQTELACSLQSFNPFSSRVVDLGMGQLIGGGYFQAIAGPCSVEGDHVFDLAYQLKLMGVSILRGGAFKPRTSPDSFQGLGKQGLELLCQAGHENEMLVVSEIMSEKDIDLYHDVDILQVGARNCQNYSLLKELGKTNKPILIKRGMATTVEELINCALYVTQAGNDRVILCERGIRTFETSTRNTLDISSVPSLHELCDFPIIVDPSHATGIKSMIAPCSMAAVACGADGLQIEVHENPELALSDKEQALTPNEFEKLMVDVQMMRSLLTK